jgi:ribosomal-protein-alanine N-acetyltransferase
MNLNNFDPNTLRLKTSRLELYPMTNNDWDNFYHLQGDPTLTQYICEPLTKIQLKEKFSQRILPWHAIKDKWLVFNINIQSTKEFIGTIGFKINCFENEQAEIGYLLLNEYQGNGFMVEAAKSISTLLFEQLDIKEIIGNCACDNLASWKVMESIGMTRISRLKQALKIGEQYYDSFSYQLLQTEYSH